MGFARCALSHPVFLVLPELCLQKVGTDYPGLPFPKTAEEVALSSMSSQQ